MTRLFLVLAVLALSACAEAPVRVASKDFAENQILAEMFALLIEDAGVPVDREIPLGNTDAVFEALRTGQTDLYPEYSGTGLALLGLPVGTDAADARERVAAELDQLGITVLEPLGFETRYSAVVGSQLAQRLDLEGVSDLAGVASDLRLVVARDFADRAEDGLQAMRDRYGLSFADIEIVPQNERRTMYDRLLDGDADLAIGFETDPQIAAYGLQVLDPGAGFGARYAAVPLVSTDALARHPAIREALAALAGRIDADTMRRLNGEVVLDGRTPAEVARLALVDFGLLEPDATIAAGPYRIAALPADLGTPMANEVLRAARRSVENRGVTLVGSETPAEEILAGMARVALTPSIAQFSITPRGAEPRADLEALAAVGSYVVHVLAAPGGPGSLREAQRIAAGREGSPSHALAVAAAGHADPAPKIVALENGSATDVAEAVRDGRADAGIVLAPAGRSDVADAIDAGGVRLVSAEGWWTGAARLAYPFLGAATIPADAYGGAPVSTLSMQAVVVGPAPPADALGQQGPSTYSSAPSPVTDRVVIAFNDNLGPHPDVGHVLPRAAALRPQIDRGQRTLNPTPGYTALSLGIMVFFVWAVWLYLRNEPQRRPD